MLKRTIATFLWFFAGLYAGDMLAEALGVSALLGPALGMSLGILVGVDPLHAIWSRPSSPKQGNRETGDISAAAYSRAD